MRIVPFLWLAVPWGVAGLWPGPLCFPGCGAGGAPGAAALPDPGVPPEAAGLQVPLLDVGRGGELAWGCWPCPKCLLHLLILFVLLLSGLVVALTLGATASVGGKWP